MSRREAEDIRDEAHERYKFIAIDRQKARFNELQNREEREEDFAKGGGVDKFQTRYLLSNYGYRGDNGTEIEVVDIQGDIVFGNPKKIKLSKFQKEMLPYE